MYLRIETLTQIFQNIFLQYALKNVDHQLIFYFFVIYKKKYIYFFL